MIFSKDTMQVGAKVVIPDSFVNNSDPAEIIGVTKVGINVIHGKGTGREQIAFYAYAWLEQMYGNFEARGTVVRLDAAKDSIEKDDLNDAIPF